MKDYNLSDTEWAELSKQAYNLAGVESNYGESKSYKILQYIPDWIINFGKQLIRGKDSPNSRGLTQIKFYQDQPINEKYKEYGITEENTKNDPYNQGRATAIKLSDINDRMASYHWKDGSPMSSEDARAILWNRGKLTDRLNEKDGTGASTYVRKYHKKSVL